MATPAEEEYDPYGNYRDYREYYPSHSDSITPPNSSTNPEPDFELQPQFQPQTQPQPQPQPQPEPEAQPSRLPTGSLIRYPNSDRMADLPKHSAEGSPYLSTAEIWWADFRGKAQRFVRSEIDRMTELTNRLGAPHGPLLNPARAGIDYGPRLGPFPPYNRADVAKKPFRCSVTGCIGLGMSTYDEFWAHMDRNHDYYEHPHVVCGVCYDIFRGRDQWANYKKHWKGSRCGLAPKVVRPEYITKEMDRETDGGASEEKEKPALRTFKYDGETYVMRDPKS